MYDILIAFVVIIQIFNFSKSLEVELFKQSLRYYSYRGYHYVKKWLYPIKKETSIEKYEKPQRYEDKYKKEFVLAEGCKTPESLKYDILMENTPNGNVLMLYDSTTSSFVYYSDKVIPHRFLDTVGRKYVVLFKCKNVFIESKDGRDCNKYMYLGKIANFSFLQKVKKGVTDKKLNMSFKDFKNMNL